MQYSTLLTSALVAVGTVNGLPLYQLDPLNALGGLASGVHDILSPLEGALGDGQTNNNNGGGSPGILGGLASGVNGLLSPLEGVLGGGKASGGDYGKTNGSGYGKTGGDDDGGLLSGIVNAPAQILNGVAGGLGGSNDLLKDLPIPLV